MSKTKKPRTKLPVPLHRFAVTLPGVNLSKVKSDLERLLLLRRTGVRRPWKVRKANAKHLFEERVWDRTGKSDIFPTDEGKAKMRELYEAGELTLRAGRQVKSLRQP
ncbi:MAG: hypothetical protein P0Y65_18420 [Candidatus Devosia phytovorans]|uniref:Uncharacterized protein n=1 Tax=Candidatus Devosia phytovorans TaxID=3121372 RepID=A0AAJ6B139_9HYPH|nr:hypothetical protein [Devosia sp.]WEK04133.1 MAG: hypothetical protein P0Y65_18420 [Devosia sp.]